MLPAGSYPICLQDSGAGISQSLEFWLYVRYSPVITWPTPAPIVYGSPLSAAQLDATTNVAGTFVYSFALGTILRGGTQTLTVTFTPPDTTDYTIATGSVILTVNKGAPLLTWPTPAPITYGTALS